MTVSRTIPHLHRLAPPDSINVSVFETGSQHVLYTERSIKTTISFLANLSSPIHPFDREPANFHSRQELLGI